MAFLSEFAKPVGALFASLFLVTFQKLVPGALAFAGGVIVFITLDEFIPTAREFGHEHDMAIGINLGSIFVFSFQEYRVFSLDLFISFLSGANL